MTAPDQIAPEVVAAKAAMDAAYKDWIDKNSALNGRIRELEAKYRPGVRSAEQAYRLAQTTHERAVAAATVNHPRHGERVFKMEKITTQSGRDTGNRQRVDGEIATWRPGDVRPTWGAGGLRPGDAIVLPILKTGKLGKKPMAFGSEWKPAAEAEGR